jgi:hypothetical protein
VASWEAEGIRKKKSLGEENARQARPSNSSGVALTVALQEVPKKRTGAMQVLACTNWTYGIMRSGAFMPGWLVRGVATWPLLNPPSC